MSAADDLLRSRVTDLVMLLERYEAASIDAGVWEPTDPDRVVVESTLRVLRSALGPVLDLTRDEPISTTVTDLFVGGKHYTPDPDGNLVFTIHKDGSYEVEVKE